MGFGALRCVIRPVSRTILSYCSASPFSFGKIVPSTSMSPLLEPRLLRDLVRRDFPWIPASRAFLHSLTDTRLPKRRPVDKPRRKRAGLRPPGPYAWVKYEPGKPSLPTQPNQGIVKRRNEKKRLKQKHTFIMAEKRKRKIEMQEAKRKKIVKRVERKMAAVARDRAWAQRLAELQQLEEETKGATA